MPVWIINRGSVSSDFVDGEVVAIHLGTGIYYSLRGPAALLWQAMDKPSDEARLIRTLAGQFEVPAEQAGKDVEAFIQQLQAEQLIVATETAGGHEPASPPGERRPYTVPQLERYADLQDLLLLDPIHEVGEQGWPHQPPKPDQPV